MLLLFTLSLLAACKSQPPVETVLEVEPAIEVIEPEFSIVSIAILQADLINTQFEAVVRISNPNEFAVDLSSINYELYGNGTFWASGKGTKLLHIPAQNFCETEFRFSMNFINMNRRLLDDVIAMRQINYRFTGAAEIEPVVENLSSFQMSFERTGLSNVKGRAD